ncbi:flagellar M-ring protein FliF [Polymorphobacter multimanifer]|uniref:Flagellar M-ring protein n=1 Tax=Polymorphobacter multimanifer TaxID=1070431 RepID=A0A841L931_9SPHN|nr:flagellar basal-body MS-ring/collar protein FliF [Polymorphobacter multimanifer]MBB6226345.1 flagellar M-ring protein FliF [Polymorphobacter multimanifer]
MAETAIIDVSAGGAKALLPQQLRDAWENPAIAAIRPAIIAAAALLLALAGWSMLREPAWRPLYAELSDGDKSAVLEALQGGNYTARINPATGGVEVPDADVAAARILLAGQGLPKSARALDPVGDMPLGMSRAVEAARLKSALAGELAASIEAIDGVKRATVHVALPEPSVFVRDRVPASASVFVTLAPGRVLGEAQVRAIVWLISSSVAGLAPERVSVVDQSGALLSAGVAAGEAAQLGYQARLEAQVRERLAKLLTPLLGQGRFTAEVTADVDFSENQSASERFEREGSVLRSEQASRSLEAAPPPARGIPGALSNTAPAAAQVAGTPPADTAAAGTSPQQITNETTNRAWEIGKDVRVSRGGAPALRRLSVAVVIDRDAIARDGKVPAGELESLRRIIAGAIGEDARRGDRIEVVLRRFAPPPEEPDTTWFQSPAVKDNWPLVLMALAGVLALGAAGWFAWRLRRIRKARAAAALAAAIGPSQPDRVDGGDLAAAPPAGADAADSQTPNEKRTAALAAAGLPPLLDYQGKLGATRELVDGDTDRATAVARMMLADDGAEPEAEATS